MSTAAQISANQANAGLSTGPRTESGKAASSRNNLRHGFRSQSVLLPGDDPAEYDALLAELAAHFQTEDLSEARFVREMADAEWRLRRVRQYTEGAITRRIAAISEYHPDAGPIDVQALAIESLESCGGPSYATWLRYETKFERQYDRAYKGWTRYQADRCRASAKDVDTMMKAALFAPLPPGAPAEVIVTEASRPANLRLPQLALNVQSSPPPPSRAASLVDSMTSTPRGAPCPCGSGLKYKRCCGHNAPPVLGHGLQKAA